MKWIKALDGDYVNFDLIYHLYVEETDEGNYEVIAEKAEDERIVINSFKSGEEAEKYLNKILGI